MEEYSYNNLLSFYSGIDTITVKGWTNLNNFKPFGFQVEDFFSDNNLTSQQTITLSGRSTNVKTVTSDNGAFEWSLITITSNPVTIPTYTTTFDTINNRILKRQGTSTINETYNNFLRYSVNWSKLAQNIIFFNTSDNIVNIKGDYLFCDTLTINSNKYYVSHFFISSQPRDTNKCAFSNVYSLFPTGTGINEDRFSYCDSQFIGTKRYDMTSIVNPNNDITKENVESDINNIISRNAVYNYSYLSDAPRKTGIPFDLIKDSTLRNFYTFGNNYVYLSGRYKDFYNIEPTGSDQPHWHSTFKNWFDWTIGADRTTPLRNIAIGTGLDDITFNNFYEAWDNIGGSLDKTTKELILNGESPYPDKISAINFWTNPIDYNKPTINMLKIPYNYMLDLETNNISSLHVGHEIITSNYCLFNSSNSFKPIIVINKVDSNKLNVNAYNPEAYEQLETVLNNIPYINLIGGSTTLLVLGILSLALIMKIGHILK
ncbi:MAG: hypothetical protein IAA85_05425 [Firmicutes bacterium]|nr:hypothetical protein [Candidatus Alectryobacillus merdavium]